MPSCSEVLSIYKKFAALVHTRFSTTIHVFHADSACVYLYHLLRRFLVEQSTLAQFSSCARGQNGVAKASIATFMRRLVR